MAVGQVQRQAYSPVCGRRSGGEFHGIERQAYRRLEILEAVPTLFALLRLPSNRFEALGGDRAGQYSIRINDRWRICFEWPDGDLEPSNIEIVDYYRGRPKVARPAIHPGEVLAGELAALEMSAAALAREFHVPTNRLTQIVNGQRAISADTALRLGVWFGTGPEFGLHLQKQYDLRHAERTVGDEIRRTVAPRPGAAPVPAPAG
jgi:antitoxin HigA-1